MKTSPADLLEASLEQNREALLDAWISAIREICGRAGDGNALRETLLTLLERIADSLFDESLSAREAESVGQDLASLTCVRSEVLGQTNLILGRFLLDGLSPDQKSIVQRALAAFLGNMAIGFLGMAHAGLLAEGDDVEEVRRAERRFYTTILDMVDALIVVSDAHGHIVGFNGASERASGYSFDDVYGRHYTFLQAPEAHEESAALVERLKSMPPEQAAFLPHESTWLTRVGERRQIVWSTTAVFDEDGAASYIIGTGTDVTASRQMEHELASAQRHVAQVKEAERLRLAQELHDDAVQQLLGISYQLAEMQQRATEADEWTPSQRLEELAPGLEAVRGDIIAVAQGLRRMISSLRPPALREMGLAEVLEVYVAEWQQGAGRTGPQVNLDLAAIAGKQLPEPVATCIFRLVQEGIWNAYKHAAANTINVSVDVDGQEVILRIKDDGRGFRIPRHLFQFATAGRFGFIGMQERVHAVDGLLSVWSIPGQGTEIQAHIPLHSAESDYGVSNTRSAR
ncbi:MAG TPA: PAS domain S-box protein [Candidatus Binatia bacterium]|nr:PAS domain S-box protein [Candidatus Binatia bacterium]